MSEPAPRQALQQRVAAAILDGAAQLFAVQGEQASMNDVAEAAGVARATVYRYFPNREALLDELARAAVSDVDARLASARIDAVAPEEGIARAVRALVDVGDSFVLLARERLRSDPEHFERRLTRAAAPAVRARPGRRRHPRRHHERPPDRVAHRAGRRRAHLDAAARQGGHDRHDHRPVPRRSPRARSAPA